MACGEAEWRWCAAPSPPAPAPGEGTDERERDRPHWVERAGTPLTTTGAERAKEAREGRRKETTTTTQGKTSALKICRSRARACTRPPRRQYLPTYLGFWLSTSQRNSFQGEFLCAANLHWSSRPFQRAALQSVPASDCRSHGHMVTHMYHLCLCTKKETPKRSGHQSLR